METGQEKISQQTPRMDPPLNDGAEKVTAATGDRGTVEMEQKPRIMVVEDEGIVALDICQTLEAVGYTVVHHANTGEDAVEKADALRPDLILMDINLAGPMDGIQAAEQISQRSPTPVVFLTAHADEVTLQRAKLTRPFGYIIKPFDSDELRTTIEISLHRAQSEASTTAQKDGFHEIEHFEIKAPSSPSETLLFLQQINIFRDCPESALQLLADAALMRAIESDEVIVLPDGGKSTPFIVASGRLAVTRAALSGKELTVELLSPGDPYGVLHYFDSGPSQDYVRSQIPSRILTFQPSAIDRLARQYPPLFKAIADELFVRVRKANELAMGLAHSKVEQRILACLNNLAPQIGKSSQLASSVRIYITRRELADLTGTTPETAIRVTKALEREGLIDLTRPGIIRIPDPSLLAERLGAS